MQRNYYAIIPANVRYDKDLIDGAKLLYGEITALCNQEGYCWASNSYFSELYGVSKKTVSNWINQLKSKGYINSIISYKEGTKQIDKRYLTIASTPMEEKVRGLGRKGNDPMEENFPTPMEEKVKDNTTVINNTFNTTTNKDVAEIIKFWDDNGFGFNNINAKEKLLSWLEDPSFKNPHEMIMKALDIASTNNKRTLGYVDGILKNWKKESILTVEETEKEKGGVKSDATNYVDDVGVHGVKLYK